MPEFGDVDSDLDDTDIVQPAQTDYSGWSAEIEAPTAPPDGADRRTDLTTAQTEFLGAECRTDVGSAFYYPDDTSMREAARDVPPFPGEYVLDVHGNAEAVGLHNTDGSYEATLSPPEFGQVVRESGWSGQDVRLLSCETGRDPEGFAQQLADELGVDVTAPTTAVTTMEKLDGVALPPIVSDIRTVYSEEAQDWFDVPELPETGRWITFHPRNRS